MEIAPLIPQGITDAQPVVAAQLKRDWRHGEKAQGGRRGRSRKKPLIHAVAPWYFGCQFIEKSVVVRLVFSTLGVLAAALIAGPSLAGPVIEQIARDGVLTAGTSKDAFPYAYQNGAGDLVGYSIDMMHRITEELALELGRPVRLKLIALDTDERISSLESSKVSLVCDASSFTWERDRKVDFSVSYGITGTQLLIRRDSNLSSQESLAGKRIGILPRTTSELAIRKQQPKAIPVLLEDRNSGYQALKDGTIDGFADDGVLLYSWLQRQPQPTGFQVGDRSYSKEGIACMLPQSDPAFQRIVNMALIRYMQGFIAGQPRETAIFDQWFGPGSAAPLTQDLRDLSIETMQLMVDLKERVPPRKSNQRRSGADAHRGT